MTNNHRQLKSRISYHLSRFTVHSAVSSSSLTAAAVALTIDASGPDACIYLTLRSSRLRKHAGQFALPGGKLDHGESVTTAARRELMEELGVALSAQAVLGTLDDFVTRSGFVITPVIIWNETKSEPTPNEAEVSRFYRVPISDLLDDKLVDQEYSRRNPVFSITPESVGTSIYSPTAAIIYQFREVALLGRETRVSHYEQPEFAWR